MAKRKNDEVFDVLPDGKVVPVKKKSGPALDPDAREEQMINLAIDLAEQQLIDGTASQAVIVHYLKLGTKTHQIEQRILSEQAKLISAKTESIVSNKNQEQLVANAISAMRMYTGNADAEE